MSPESDFTRWEEETLNPALKRNPERKPSFKTSSGIPVPRVLPPPEADPDYAEKLGFPGEYPFTRGVQPTMYRGRFWTMRQYAGYATAEESNRRYRYLLEQGQTGLSVAFDLPTQIGYDADDPMALGEVGKVGVSISSLDDMAGPVRRDPAGQGLHQHDHQRPGRDPAGDVHRRRQAAGRGNPPAARHHPERHPQGIHRPRHLYLPAAALHAPDHRRLPLLPDGDVPHWNTISISGYHIREAGSTAVQEVAFTLANAIAYVQAAIDAGLDVDNFAEPALLLLQRPQ